MAFEKLKEKTSIEAVARHLGIELIASGKDPAQFRSPCPACAKGGKNALAINTLKQKFYCWASNEHGDLIDLYMHLEKIDNANTAAKHLENMLAVPVAAKEAACNTPPGLMIRFPGPTSSLKRDTITAELLVSIRLPIMVVGRDEEGSLKIAGLYQSITNRIVFELENGGVLPWLKPWKNIRQTGNLMPHNFATGNAYRGINVPLLWHQAFAKRYEQHLWLSYRQALGIGGQVRGGEKGTDIVFTKKLGGKDKDDNPKQFSMLKTFSVFNIAQVDGLTMPTTAELPEGSRNERLDAVIAETSVRIHHEGNQACYMPSRDCIMMPLRGQFKNEESYYATMFHELGHETGAKHRLDRDLSGRFGTHKYAAEELVAEMCSAFLCASLGVEGELRHAGYLQNWLELLKQDDHAIFTAASKAQQAADYIHNGALRSLQNIEP